MAYYHSPPNPPPQQQQQPQQQHYAAAGPSTPLLFPAPSTAAPLATYQTAQQPSSQWAATFGSLSPATSMSAPTYTTTAPYGFPTAHLTPVPMPSGAPSGSYFTMTPSSNAAAFGMASPQPYLPSYATSRIYYPPPSAHECAAPTPSPAAHQYFFLAPPPFPQQQQPTPFMTQQPAVLTPNMPDVRIGSSSLQLSYAPAPTSADQPAATVLAPPATLPPSTTRPAVPGARSNQALRFSERSRQKRSNKPLEVPPPPQGATESTQLIITKLAADVTTPQLEALFAQFEGFVAARVVVDGGTGFGKGWGYLWFTTQEAAMNTIFSAAGRVLLGKRIGLVFASPQRTLDDYVANPSD